MKRHRIVELVLIAVVLLMLSSVALVRINHPRKPRIGATRLTISSIIVALDQYAKDTGAFPDPKAGLETLVAKPNNSLSRGPYLTRLPTDGWGHAFNYRLINGKPEVMSAGPDGILFTGDDLTN